MDRTARSTSYASNKDPASFPYTKTTGIAGTPMANVVDMEIEIRQLARIALIDSAVELVKIFSNRKPTISGDTIFDIEQPAYESALEFLQMQYELERPCVHIKTDERAPTTRPAQAE